MWYMGQGGRPVVWLRENRPAKWLRHKRGWGMVGEGGCRADRLGKLCLEGGIDRYGELRTRASGKLKVACSAEDTRGNECNA